MEETVLERAMEAYLWGYPLVVMHRSRALLCSQAGQGTMVHRERLATPADRSVVAPNNDTVYSSGWFDLRYGDVVVHVPPMDRPDRYWNVMVLDAYTHVTYLSRRHYGVDGCTVRLTHQPEAESRPGKVDVLSMATPTVWVIVRVLVAGPNDLPSANEVQRAIVFAPPPDHPTARTKRLGRPNEVHLAGTSFFGELRTALLLDPPAPWHPPVSAAALDVATGRTVADDDELVLAASNAEHQLAEHGVGGDRRQSGWATRLRGADFGDDVLARAAAAKYVLAGHHPEENRAYIADTDPQGNRLDGRRPVLLRFPADGTPPCTGFWSLTPYDSEMYLADNPIDRYSIGDRTDGLQYERDGSLAITVGGALPSDTRNWLPAPQGPYRLALRVYEGQPEVVDATWFPPALVPALEP